jgi:hypothetical protein
MKKFLLILILAAPALAQAVPVPLVDPYSPFIAAAAAAQARAMSAPGVFDPSRPAIAAMWLENCSNPKMVNIQDVAQVTKCQNFMRILWSN